MAVAQSIQLWNLIRSLFLSVFRHLLTLSVGGVAQLVERRSLAGELSLSCARPAADG